MKYPSGDDINIGDKVEYKKQGQMWGDGEIIDILYHVYPIVVVIKTRHGNVKCYASDTMPDTRRDEDGEMDAS